MMVHTWKRQIPCTNYSPGCLEGIFYRKTDQVYFFYNDKNGVCIFGQNEAIPRVIPIDFPVRSRWLPYIVMPHDCMTLPSEWLLYEEHEPPYLMLNSTVGIDLLHMKPCNALPPEATEHYFLQKRIPEKGSVLLQTADYVIYERGERGYLCERNGIKQWTFSGSAYLYTRIICVQDSLVFGTAGNGGHLYVLSLETGKKVADIKTGGTVAFVQQDNLCYFLVNAPTAKLVCLDVLSGQIIDEVSLNGKNYLSPLQLIGNQLHTVTFTFKNRQFVNAFWHCISL